MAISLENAFVVTGGGARLEQFRRCLDAVGIDGGSVKAWRWCRIEGEGSMGNAVAQYALVRHALEAKLPHVIIFEDDAVPRDDAARKLAEAFETRDVGTLCLSLGWSDDSDPGAGCARGAKRRVYGSHAYALFGEKAYRAYIDAWERNGRADVVLGAMEGSVLAGERVFAQHTPEGEEGIHLPAGWTTAVELEREVDGELKDRYGRARAEIEKMKRAREMHVAYTVDVQGAGAVQFLDQLLVSVFTLRETMERADRICCHVFYGSIPAETMRRINALADERFRVAWHPIPEDELGYMQTLTKNDPKSPVRTWSGIVFARLWLPLWLRDVDRVVYTDADTLFRRSIRPLWEQNLAGFLLGCPKGSVPEYGFYSGLMVMNLAALRLADLAEGLFCALKSHMEKYAKDYLLPDQTTVNRFFAGRIAEVGRGWCHPPRPGGTDFAGLRDASIWHFYEGRKPRRMDGDEWGRASLWWGVQLNKALEATGVKKEGV